MRFLTAYSSTCYLFYSALCVFVLAQAHRHPRRADHRHRLRAAGDCGRGSAECQLFVMAAALHDFIGIVPRPQQAAA